MGNKKALLVGINYPNTSHALNGCVNDVNTMADLLMNHFEFEPKTIRMLTDESATTANIMERLHWLVEGAQPGDVLFFHYSGHGSQFVDIDYEDNDKEPDGLDEILCPIDLNWRDKIIKDDDLKEIFNTLPIGVNLTVVLDCCHSGSGLDQDNYFHPLGVGEARTLPGPNRVRELPMPADIANRARGLNLSIKTRQLVNRNIEQVGLLISGCQPHQTSADAWIHSRYMGAATYFLVYHIRHNNYQISYRDLVTNMNHSLRNYGYSQRPELNGNPNLWERNFLQPEDAPSSDDDKEGDTTNQDQLNQNQPVESADSQNQNVENIVEQNGGYSSGTEEETHHGETYIADNSENGEKQSKNGKRGLVKAIAIGIAVATAGAALGFLLFN